MITLSLALLASLFAAPQEVGVEVRPQADGSPLRVKLLPVPQLEQGQEGRLLLLQAPDAEVEAEDLTDLWVAQVPGEERAWIGVEISTAVSDRPGLEVVRVIEDSPASRAGLKVGDRLLALDGERLADFAGLRQRLDGRRPGQSVQLALRRTLEVRLDDRGHGEEGPRLGVRLSTQQEAGGLLVTSVEPGWPAASAGLRGGDRIVTSDGRPVGEFSDLQQALARVDPGESIRLGIDRRVELELRSFPASLSAPDASLLSPDAGTGWFQVEPPREGPDPDAAPRPTTPWLAVPGGPEGPSTPTPRYRLERGDPDQLQQQMRELAAELRSLREELASLRRELEQLRRDR